MTFAHRAPGGSAALDLLTDWHLHPGVAAALATTATAYIIAVMQVRRTGRAWPIRRSAAFLAGLALLAVALQSALDSFSAALLSAHMVQHLALTLLAPPLLLLGAPVSLALRALPRGGRGALGKVVASTPAKTIAHPVVAWAVFVAVMVGTHFSPLYDAAVSDPLLHAVEHALYITAGVLFWLPLVGADPVPRPSQPAIRILYLLAAMPPMALVGVALFSAATVRYPAYLGTAAELGISALADQHLGGMVMFVGGTAVLAVATVVLGWGALLREERGQRTRDAYAARCGDVSRRRSASKAGIG